MAHVTSDPDGDKIHCENNDGENNDNDNKNENENNDNDKEKNNDNEKNNSDENKIDKNASLKYSLLGPSLTKAGQDAVDQTKVSEIIYNASKGSKFFSREAAKDEILTRKIDTILAHKARLAAQRERNVDDTLHRELRAADALLAQLELDRDLTRVIVHVDCDAFYAAVEQLHRPELAEKPFAVGGGVLSTCNYVARKFGCRSGMAGFVAKNLCPDLILLPSNFARYGAKAEEVREVLAEYDPRFESASCDEAYLDLTTYCEQKQMTPEDAVQQMRDQIHERTKITVSAGIAANARLAKICSNMNKPNGQYLLPSSRAAIMDFMAKLPPRKVNGIGRVLERELSAVGIDTCGEVYAQRGFLRPLFGDKAAEFLMAIYLGLGRTNIQPAQTYERKSVGTERTFTDLGDPKALRERLRQTAEGLEADMRRAECKGRTLCIKIKMHTFELHTRQVVSTRKLLSEADDIYALALPMLEKLEKEFPGMRLRLMGLRCTGLSSTRKPDAQAFFGLKAKPNVVRYQTRGAGDAIPDDGQETAETSEEAVRSKIDEVEGAWDDVKDEADQAFVQEVMSLSQERMDPDFHGGGGVQDGQDEGGDGVRNENEAGDVQVGDHHDQETKDDWWDCPVCMRPQVADERVFNQHIDLCLSRQTIREAIQAAAQEEEEAEAAGGQGGRRNGHLPASPVPSAVAAAATPSSKKRGRKGGGGSGHDPRQKKLCFGRG